MQELRHTPRAILLYESALGGAQQDEIFGIIPAPHIGNHGIKPISMEIGDDFIWFHYSYYSYDETISLGVVIEFYHKNQN